MKKLIQIPFETLRLVSNSDLPSKNCEHLFDVTENEEDQQLNDVTCLLPQFSI
jgi:hypothetical protein